MTIYFYKVCDPYGCFSNFSEHSIELEGKIWPSTEHYYQAQKFVGTSAEALCQQIYEASTPAEAAALGRDPHHPVRSDWEQIKTVVMEKAVLQKFTTYSTLKELLMGTGNELIVEDSPTDGYWGCGEDGRGQNHLGKVLMRVRSCLRRQQDP
jgi:N-glycosidase YbiA